MEPHWMGRNTVTGRRSLAIGVDDRLTINRDSDGDADGSDGDSS